MRVTKRQLRRLIRESVRINESLDALRGPGSEVIVDNYRGDPRVGVHVDGVRSSCNWVWAQDRVAPDGMPLDDHGDPQFGLCVGYQGPHADIALRVAASQPQAGGGLIDERTGALDFASPGLISELEQMRVLNVLDD